MSATTYSTTTQVEDLCRHGWSVRSTNCLLNGGFETVGDIAKATARELFKIRGLGLKSLREIRGKLQQIGLDLRANPDHQRLAAPLKADETRRNLASDKLPGCPFTFMELEAIRLSLLLTTPTQIARRAKRSSGWGHARRKSVLEKIEELQTPVLKRWAHP